MRGKWRQIVKEVPTPAVASDFLWADDADRVLRYRAEVSSNMPTNRVIFADWADLVVGVWGALDVVVDPYTQSRRRVIATTTSAYVDIGLRHVESFCASTDSGAA